MQEARSRLESAAKTCLSTTLASLAMMAVLVNAAFYSMWAVDYWPVARLLGPAILVSAMAMAASFILGLVLHGVVVVKGRRQAFPRTQVVRTQPHVGRTA